MLFYDNFTPDQICGIFSPTHIIVATVLILFLIVALIFSRKMSERTSRKVVLSIAIVVIVLEIVKITLRVCKGQGGDSWIPLYFCSLFLFAVVLVQFKSKVLSDIGWLFIVFGGIVASVGFIILPSTSLAIFPIWHPASIHSLIYHFLMAYTGFLAIFNKLYTPRPIHFVYYFFFTGVFSVMAVVVNSILGTNMMFFSNPFGISWLKFVKDFSPTLYALLAYFAQCVALYWVTYLEYFVYIKISEKIKRRKS